MKRRLITISISLISLFFIISLLQSIYTLWQKGGIVAEREALRDKLKEENSNLKDKLAQAESQEFIEKQAREKLNLQRPGEVVVVLPKDLTSEAAKSEKAEHLSNWQRWWRLFF